jgi:hypothetical protein
MILEEFKDFNVTFQNILMKFMKQLFDLALTECFVNIIL